MSTPAPAAPVVPFNAITAPAAPPPGLPVGLQMIACNSSALHAYGYDAAARALHLQFKVDGPLYSYFEVPPVLVAQLAAAESKGKFIGANVRGKFPAAPPAAA